MNYKRLGITPIANPDFNPLYSVSGELVNGFNTSSTLYETGNNYLLVSGNQTILESSSLTIPTNNQNFALVNSNPDNLNLSGIELKNAGTGGNCPSFGNGLAYTCLNGSAVNGKYSVSGIDGYGLPIYTGGSGNNFKLYFHGYSYGEEGPNLEYKFTRSSWYLKQFRNIPSQRPNKWTNYNLHYMWSIFESSETEYPKPIIENLLPNFIQYPVDNGSFGETTFGIDTATVNPSASCEGYEDDTCPQIIEVMFSNPAPTVELNSKLLNLNKEWPAPCEYFEPSTAPIENYFRFDNSGDLIPNIISSGTGLNTSIHNLLNSKTGEYISFNLLNENYVFSLTNKYFSGSGYFLNGFISKYDDSSEYLINYNTETYISPSIQISGSVYKFRFIQSVTGNFQYKTQYKKKINDLWVTTGINLVQSIDQSGVPNGSVRKEFTQSAPSLSTGFYYRMRSFQLFPVAIGHFYGKSGQNVINMDLTFNLESENKPISYILSSSGASAIIQKNVIYV